jgi:hypothetical protein
MTIYASHCGARARSEEAPKGFDRALRARAAVGRERAPRLEVAVAPEARNVARAQRVVEVRAARDDARATLGARIVA